MTRRARARRRRRAGARPVRHAEAAWIVELLLNGRRVAFEAGAGETLLEALRRESGLRSVRATCGIGVCGACTVLLDGQPVSACLMLAPQAAGREVTTVEGLPPEDPAPRAFGEARAFQCG